MYLHFCLLQLKKTLLWLSFYPPPPPNTHTPVFSPTTGELSFPEFTFVIFYMLSEIQIHSLSSRTHRYISLSVYYAMTPTNLKLSGNKITSFFINPAIVPVLLPVKITNDDRETKILFSQIFSCCKASYCTEQKSSSLL